MVHKKYIKKDGKIFGPYLYENYRKDGVVKTKYLGRADGKAVEEASRRIFNKKFFLILGIILAVLVFSLFLLKENGFGELSSDLRGIFNNLKGDLFSENVNVFVQLISNSPPRIFIDNEIFVCENTALNYSFNVEDSEGNILDLSFYPFRGISFFFNPDPTRGGILNKINMFSRVLNKGDVNARRRYDSSSRRLEGWAVYPENISVTDGLLSDTADVNITLIEVNNAPGFNIDVVTIWTRGDNTNFYYDLGSFLRNNGEETLRENLIFNLAYSNGSISPFNIINGVINITGNESFIDYGDVSKVYDLRVCVNDTGLESIPHLNISFCWNYGYDVIPLAYCDDFSLTITKGNRRPNITSYYPANLSLNISGTEKLYFNITSYDPDWTIPYVYWYVNDSLKSEDSSGNFSEFEYIFGCSVSGNHTIRVVATDGLLNDSIEWNFNVKQEDCQVPIPEVGGGGGGGGGSIGRLYCEEKWGCDEWNQCLNFKKLYESGWVSEENKLLIEERCKLLNYGEDICGYQTRICKDFNYCKTQFNRPGILRECYFTENPNCTDGIKNCHDGFCEVLADCGGACKPCPTCSDGIQNQNEAGVDCGGICNPCEEIPFRILLFRSIVLYSLIILIILIVILFLIQARKYYIIRKMSKKDRAIKNSQMGKYGKLFFIIFVIFFLFFANSFIMNSVYGKKAVLDIENLEGIWGIGSLNLLNSIARGLGIFFISGVLENDNSRLQMWDTSDSLDRYTICDRYCIQKAKFSSNLWTFYFYADYRDKSTGNPISNADGNCEIRFQDEIYNYGGWNSMSYNSSSQLWEYSRTFDYKGNYNFEVSCSYSSLSVNGEDDFEIINTEPYIIKTAAGYIDFDANGEKNILQCSEDAPCFYNFSANVSEDDLNDNLIFGWLPTANTTLTNFAINPGTGLLEINITHSDFTGIGKKVELSVRDSERIASAVLEVNVQNINDAPVFLNLEDKAFNANDLFEYIIYVTDEENNFPFKFNIDFMSCSNEVSRGNCTLFTNSQYSVDEAQGRINMSFIPGEVDVGDYIINFSVMDNNSLGNKTASQAVNFSVRIPIWKDSVVLEHLLTEDENFYLNLSLYIRDEYSGRVNFSYMPNARFPSFNLDLSTGIINLTPVDEDVGAHKIEASAGSEITSSKIFNFTVLNINDNVSIDSFQAINADISGFNITAYENSNVKLYLYTRDDDFKISQKNFYDEILNLSLNIEGVNTTLFRFVEGALTVNIMEYIAEFVPRDLDVGNYNITINVSDLGNSSDILNLDLIVFNRDYDYPFIIFPNESYEFSLRENASFNLTFRANHTIGDNLTYRFYINETLRYELDFYGDGRDFIWEFSPNFSDETHGKKENLTLIVLNPFFNEFNASRSWNITINHTNAPVNFRGWIGDKLTSYKNSIMIDLKDYFSDVDYDDLYYNQSVNFIVRSNESSSKIGWGISDWSLVLFPLVGQSFKELLNITASDLNESGEVMTNATSNNFIIEFTEPIVETVTIPASGGGGGGGGGEAGSKIVALKIITPGPISTYEYEKISVPVYLINNGKVSFSDLNLSVLAFKDGDIAKEVNASLDRNYLKSLKPAQRENLTLTMFFGTDKIGNYEIFVNASSKAPQYNDWGKLYINLQRINESKVKELIIFTKELIVQNPACMEIKEVVEEADELFEKGDFVNAKLKTEGAINACRESISQVSLPKARVKFYAISLYLILAILLAIGIGILYYFLKRRKLQNIRNFGLSEVSETEIS